jgi:hypothetical protein
MWACGHGRHSFGHIALHGCYCSESRGQNSTCINRLLLQTQQEIPRLMLTTKCAEIVRRYHSM